MDVNKKQLLDTLQAVGSLPSTQFMQSSYDPEILFKNQLDSYISHLKIQRDMYISMLMQLKDKAEKIAEHNLPSVKAQLEEEARDFVEKAEAFGATLSTLTKLKDTLAGTVEKASKKK